MDATMYGWHMALQIEAQYMGSAEAECPAARAWHAYSVELSIPCALICYFQNAFAQISFVFFLLWGVSRPSPFPLHLFR